MIWVLLTPFLLQWMAISIDEFIFHRQRGLPRWERIGHPLDTITVLICYLWVFIFAPTGPRVAIYGFLVLASSLFVTKDEFVHREHCGPWEQWLHGLLFVTHPLSLVALGLFWPVLHGQPFYMPWISQTDLGWIEPLILVQFLGIVLFCIYQVVYWNFIYPRRTQRSLLWRK